MTAFFPRPPADLLPEFARMLDRTCTPGTASIQSSELDLMMLYLEKALGRAIRIRGNATAGSYLERVLQRTINGLEAEIAQLRYLLAQRDFEPAVRSAGPSTERMRPAI
ncbi:hypothetical protein [Roseibium sediminis]|uniref:hypothetical protein n=1 Tax=Roseibium sediminis TaxID=1775174 RepID=UPI001957996A|nr:hypothetical protein [Roseibium sediminis]